MNEVRDALAQRLWTITRKVHKETMGGLCDGFEFYDGWDTLHAELANECIRQMYWAREGGPAYKRTELLHLAPDNYDPFSQVED